LVSTKICGSKFKLCGCCYVAQCWEGGSKALRTPNGRVITFWGLSLGTFMMLCKPPSFTLEAKGLSGRKRDEALGETGCQRQRATRGGEHGCVVSPANAVLHLPFW